MPPHTADCTLVWRRTHEDVTVAVRQWNADGYFEEAKGLRTVGHGAPASHAAASASGGRAGHTQQRGSRAPPPTQRSDRRRRKKGANSGAPAPAAPKAVGMAALQAAGLPAEVVASLAQVVADGQAAAANSLGLRPAALDASAPGGTPGSTTKPSNAKKKKKKKGKKGGASGGPKGRAAQPVHQVGHSAGGVAPTDSVAWSAFQGAAPSAAALPVPTFGEDSDTEGEEVGGTPPVTGASPALTGVVGAPAAVPEPVPNSSPARPLDGAALLASLRGAAPVQDQQNQPAPAIPQAPAPQQAPMQHSQAQQYAAARAAHTHAVAMRHQAAAVQAAYHQYYAQQAAAGSRLAPTATPLPHPPHPPVEAGQAQGASPLQVPAKAPPTGPWGVPQTAKASTTSIASAQLAAKAASNAPPRQSQPPEAGRVQRGAPSVTSLLPASLAARRGRRKAKTRPGLP